MNQHCTIVINCKEKNDCKKIPPLIPLNRERTRKIQFSHLDGEMPKAKEQVK
jgi:hypothetical protein